MFGRALVEDAGSLSAAGAHATITASAFACHRTIRRAARMSPTPRERRVPQVRALPLGANLKIRNRSPSNLGYFRFFHLPISLACRFHGAYKRIVG
jgi:hypothetical protein